MNLAGCSITAMLDIQRLPYTFLKGAEKGTGRILYRAQIPA